MITHLKPASGAHVGAKSSVSFIMWQVMLALLPATVFGIWCFGWPALNMFVITVSSAVFFEVICIRIAGRVAKPVIKDGSAILTGWLLPSNPLRIFMGWLNDGHRFYYCAGRTRRGTGN